ncbi:MAG: cobalamin-dependent protein [Melioribacteraceae bacterium]|nr:cobalamin-dependent protein [Melioribacteraceae bacterium]
MAFSETVYLHYLSALLEGDKNTCRSIINNLMNEKTDVKIIYKDVIQKSMVRIGELWDKCRICITTEHVATEITKEMLSVIKLHGNYIQPVNKTVLVTCVQKEFHELGARLISDFFEMKGWNSIFAGANTPPKELMKFISEKKPDLVGISNNFYLNVIKLFETIDMIKLKYPDQRIIIGGHGPENCYVNVIAKYPDITYINTLEELENYITESFNI